MKILLIHVLAHELDFAALFLGLETDLCRIGNLGNLSYDILIDRRCNLRTVTPAIALFSLIE